MNSQMLHNKNAVIGAGGSVGSTITKAIAEEGARSFREGSFFSAGSGRQMAIEPPFKPIYFDSNAGLSVAQPEPARSSPLVGLNSNCFPISGRSCNYPIGPKVHFEEVRVIKLCPRSPFWIISVSPTIEGPAL
jgi:hypothetical protein